MAKLKFPNGVIELANGQDTIPNHKWGHIKSNWYFAKNGMAFCTEHLPEFVKTKRAGK